MTESSLQSNNLPWQLRQIGKNLSEWIQLQLAQDAGPDEPPPTFEFPAWMGQLMFWCLVLGAIVWLAWLIAQFVDQYIEARQGKQRPTPQVYTVAPPTHQSVAAWLRQAHKHEQAGQWSDACRALYMAALQLLHDREWIPHQVSRTDGEYLRATQAVAPSRPLQMLIRTHERSLFGGETLQADNVKRCRQAFEAVEKP